LSWFSFFLYFFLLIFFLFFFFCTHFLFLFFSKNLSLVYLLFTPFFILDNIPLLIPTLYFLFYSLFSLISSHSTIFHIFLTLSFYL
jgi:hypothetical protein